MSGQSSCFESFHDLPQRPRAPFDAQLGSKIVLEDIRKVTACPFHVLAGNKVLGFWNIAFGVLEGFSEPVKHGVRHEKTEVEACERSEREQGGYEEMKHL